MIGCAPWVSPDRGRDKICMILVRMVMEPTAKSPPYFCREVLKQMLSRLSVLCIINGDRPSARTGIRIPLEIFIFEIWIFNVVFFPVRNLRTQTAEIHWEIMVASAAPWTPICKPNIRIGSKTILITAPITTVNMLILAKP